MRSPFLSGRQVACSRPKNTAISATKSFREEDCCHCDRQYPLTRLTKNPAKKTGNERDVRPKAAKQERALVEAIILQAAEDMWDSVHRKESIAFFTGEGFATCAQILWRSGPQKLRLLRFIKQALHRKTQSTVLLPS